MFEALDGFVIAESRGEGEPPFVDNLYFYGNGKKYAERVIEDERKCVYTLIVYNQDSLKNLIHEMEKTIEMEYL